MPKWNELDNLTRTLWIKSIECDVRAFCIANNNNKIARSILVMLCSYEEK